MECLLCANCYGDQTGPRLWELRGLRRRERLPADSLTPHSTLPVHRYSLSMLSNRSSASRWCDSRFYTEEVQGAGWGDSGQIQASKEAELGGLLQDGGRGGPLSLVRTRTCDPPRDQSTQTVGQQEGEFEAAGGTALGPHLPLAKVSPGLLL